MSVFGLLGLDVKKYNNLAEEMTLLASELRTLIPEVRHVVERVKKIADLALEEDVEE